MTAAGFAQRHSHRMAGQCGIPVAGIALCLSRFPDPGDATLELRNTGPKDTVLNLGIMLANGARQYPTAITLVLTDAEGRQHHAELAGPAILNGRIDPFIVPFPSGASLRLPLHISEWVLYASGHMEEISSLDPKKHYTVQAQFTGKSVGQAEANADVKGLVLIPYWTGVVVSNIVAIGPK
jgi:hypothetical protein